LKDELEVKKEEEECMAPGGSKERGEHKEEKRHEVSGDVDDSSTCSTPTFIDTYSKPQVFTRPQIVSTLNLYSKP